MELNPKKDIKIDKYNLDKEAENIADLIRRYDENWNNYTTIYQKIEKQIENLQDELKMLRMQLSFKIKTETAITDKQAEMYPYTQKEYIDKFNTLKQLREEYADAKSIADKYQNYHYQLFLKSNKIDLLYKMFANEYFMDSQNKNLLENEEPVKLVKKIKREN